MKEISFSAGNLIEKLLDISRSEKVCILDSGGVDHLNSRYLIAGVKPKKVLKLTDRNPEKTLRSFTRETEKPDRFGFFTISYDFGLKIEKIRPRIKPITVNSEPDIFLAIFENIVLHDYNENRSFLVGQNIEELESVLENSGSFTFEASISASKISSNFSRAEYIKAIESIRERIRCGDTYQTNLTQQFKAHLDKDVTPQLIFERLRNSHPAPFSAFISRGEDHVVSISPERFFCVRDSIISASPIKGTRPRGKNSRDDKKLRRELNESEKDRAENLMIVDLLRNDIGRISEFGTVAVEKLCELEEHPSLFHLVSTIRGKLRGGVDVGAIIKATFPCGSITGAPKIQTMRIIDEIETANRGLSMGAIGYFSSGSEFGFANSLDLSVAIRTMVVRDNKAVFNVGGGIVYDSDPIAEYEESLLKAKALFAALNSDFS